MRDESRIRPMLPVSLLVGGKPCMVVGGGVIAERKVGHLLDAEAAVTVVSPSVTDTLARLAESGRIRRIVREFAEADVAGQYLAYAATDDSAVNRRVLASCRAHGILCSAADENWTESDFVSPAISRKGGLIVTVATGGRSCKQARVVKDRIAELLDGLACDEQQ